MSKKKNLQAYFAEFIDYCEYTKRLRPATTNTYKNVWDHFTNLLPEVTEADQLSTEVINQFFKKLQTRKRQVGREFKRTGVKDSTVSTYGRKLHAFFNWLVIQGVLKDNPIDISKLPVEVYDDKRALPRDVIEKIIAATVQNAKNSFLMRRGLAMINVLMYCGLRKTELLMLKVSDVDFFGGVLTVQGTTSKSKRTRFVPINGQALRVLEDYMDARKERGSQCEYLWLSETRDARFTEHGLKHWVDRIREWSGVRFHVHQFRHSFACMLGKNKSNVVFIQKLLGHVDLRMTQGYLRSLGVEDIRDDIDQLSLGSLSRV